METVWPWLVVAGLGALHGLNPVNGWMFAAAWGVRSGDRAQVRSALMPIAIGHAASVALVVCAIARGIWMDRAMVQGLAGALLMGIATLRWLRGGPRVAGGCVAGTHITVGTRRAGIAIWSCLMATAHGAGLMLVPALVPLCTTNTPARAITASGSLVLALVAVGVHMAALLLTIGAIAAGVCRGASLRPRLMSSAAMGHAWTVALATTGILLMTLKNT